MNPGTTPGVKPGTTPGINDGDSSEAVGKGAVLVEAGTESVLSTAVFTVVVVVSGPGTVIVVRGKTVVSEDRVLEGLGGETVDLVDREEDG